MSIASRTKLHVVQRNVTLFMTSYFSNSMSKDILLIFDGIKIEVALQNQVNFNAALYVAILVNLFSISSC